MRPVLQRGPGRCQRTAGPAHSRCSIAQLTTWLSTDPLRHNSAARFLLSQMVEAHETVERGLVAGNTIVNVIAG